MSRLLTPIRKNDNVVVVSGKDRGKRGRVLKLTPGKNRLIVEGVNLVKKHQRKTQENPEGAIIEKEASIHCSNIMASSRYDARTAKAS